MSSHEFRSCSSALESPMERHKRSHHPHSCGHESGRNNCNDPSLAELQARHLESTIEIHSRLSVLGDHGRRFRTSLPSMFLSDSCRTWKESAWQLCGVRDLLTIREQWVQVVTAALLGTSALYIDCVAQVYLQQHVEGTGSDAGALVDMGFKLFGYWNAPHAADIALVSFIALTVLRFVIFPGPYAMRWTIIRRWFICMGMLFLLRGMSIIATILPNPDKECKSSIHPKGSGDENGRLGGGRNKKRELFLLLFFPCRLCSAGGVGYGGKK
eukprot:GEMP01067364.1.p1 GENE.GEMP01067364.1~~GEMP01067364.1.p1  ORF type:complete len:270 (+),score=57.20 GEMP01067364.1:302-1111(+)